MLTFRIAITVAVMAFITALTACLILIQIATFHAAAREAASAAMEAASANTLSRLEAQISELNAVVRVLSTNPSLADSDDRSEVDGAIVVFKAALHELPQTDSLYVGYDNGCWLQVRRLDVLDPTERQKLGAPPGAVYNVNLVRPTSGRALPMRRIFEDGQGNKIGQLDLPDYGYDARKRVWYRDTMPFGVLIAHPEFARLVDYARTHPSHPQLPEIGEIRSGLVGAIMRRWDGSNHYEGSMRDEDGRDYLFRLQRFSQDDEYSGYSLLLAAEDNFAQNAGRPGSRFVTICLV
jgi:adenylate cyclase